MDKRISQFNNHIDNIKETIKANDINVLGKSINNTEKNVLDLSDKTFSERAFFALENSLKANALFLDDLKNPYKIFQAKSENIFYDANESCITLKQEGSVQEGVVQSTVFVPEYPSNIKELLLMVDDYIPKGAAIHYFISVDGKSFFPMKPNISELTVLAESGRGVFIKAKLIKNRNFESPKIYGWAVLYKDPILESLYGINNYDLSRFDEEVVGETVLLRDRTNDDRIVMVIDPTSITEIHYDPKKDNRLDHIVERIDDRTIKESMNYGEYYNSKGKYEEVLLGTTKRLVTDVPAMGEIPKEYLEALNRIAREESGEV